MTFGPVPRFVGEVAEKINEEMQELVPVEKLQERRNWRDQALTKLSILKAEMNKKS